MLKRLNNNRGAALIITLAILAMVSMVTFMSFDKSTIDVELSYNQLHEEQAFYVADAGLKRSVVELLNDRNWRGGYDDVEFGEGSFSVTITDSSENVNLGDTLVIFAIGKVKNAVSQLELRAIPVPFTPFSFAMFGDDLVDIKSKMKTDSYNSDSGSYAATVDTLWGSLGSNGIIDINNNADIGGDILNSNSGGNSIHSGATIHGATSDTEPQKQLPLVPQEDFDLAETTNGNDTGMSGSYSYNMATHAFQTTGSVQFLSGTYYFSSVTLKNSADISLAPGAKVELYVTGDIELKNSASINSGGKPSNFKIWSQGDFLLKNSGNTSVVFYNPEGTADLRNSGEYYGAIVASDIFSHNSAFFHYDRSLSRETGAGTERIDKAGWTEVY